MKAINFTTQKIRLVAALFCVAYILIQSFQEYVFRTIPAPNNLTEELLQGAMPIHISRSMLLLLSFFTMIYIFLVIILHDFRKNILLFAIAFLGLFIFCFLEIGIRSIELFYTQLQMPAAFLQTKDQDVKNSIISNYSAFQSVQTALYFPLMLTQAIASAIISFVFSPRPKINFLIRTAFALNAFRLVGRLTAMFFDVNWFDSFSGGLYLPFTIVIFGLITIWLIKAKDQIHISDRSA
ncbi:MAG: hypothetical protein WKF87_02420 [Chryseolinea sp.]